MSVEEPEWDVIEIRLMEALREIEDQTCGGCGGDLTVNLTDKPPHEDDGGGHFHRWHHYWCRECVSRARLDKQLQVDDEKLADTGMYPWPSARYLVSERLPIPTDDPQLSS